MYMSFFLVCTCLRVLTMVHCWSKRRLFCIGLAHLRRELDLLSGQKKTRVQNHSDVHQRSSSSTVTLCFDSIGSFVTMGCERTLLAASWRFWPTERQRIYRLGAGGSRSGGGGEWQGEEGPVVLIGWNSCFYRWIFYFSDRLFVCFSFV